jgi:hypothetical protein
MAKEGTYVAKNVKSTDHGNIQELEKHWLRQNKGKGEKSFKPGTENLP